MNKELKRMSRSELLELLINQIEENEKLTLELEECRRKLEHRDIALHNAGSIAEAALKLNSIFEAADEAAMQYVDSVRMMSATNEGVSMEISGETTSERIPLTEKYALLTEKNNDVGEEKKELTEKDSPQVEEAKNEAEMIITVAKAQARKIVRDADAYWEETKRRAKALLKE